MSSDQSCDESLLSRLDIHLRIEDYAQTTSSNYIGQARRFLKYLAKRNIAVDDAKLSDISRHLHNERQRYSRHHGHPPKSGYTLFSSQARGLHMLLRLIHGQWPPTAVPSTPTEVFQQQICREYVRCHHGVSIASSGPG